MSVDMNDKLIRNLRDLGHTMRFLFEGKASQSRILIILSEVGTITQRDLTSRLGVQPGTASEVLAKLEHTALIKRSESSADRRTVNIRLTKEGEALAKQAALQRKQRHEEMFSCLAEEEKKTLLFLLEKVHDDWEEKYSRNNGGTQHVAVH